MFLFLEPPSEEIIKKIKHDIVLLRSMVHSRFCKNINECPREHWLCKHSLSMQTAVWWNIAETLYDIMCINCDSGSDHINRCVIEYHHELQTYWKLLYLHIKDKRNQTAKCIIRNWIIYLERHDVI